MFSAIISTFLNIALESVDEIVILTAFGIKYKIDNFNIYIRIIDFIYENF